ncbi:MAG: exopolysaccharide biosynthesis polyprenyl glycosylphosphotransferase [Cardiobacteriaceae bacterium]|nr:exopolysaccharide biosynthesis polyprenyl glycosylphosphotransferase [Cardiobacteriaceae bacterium]
MKQRHYINYSHILARLADFFAVYAGAYFSYWLCFDSRMAVERYQWMSLSAALLVVMLFSYLGVYQSWRGAVRMALVSRIVRGFFWLVAIIMGYLYLAQKNDMFSRQWLLLWFVFSVGTSVAIRFVIYRLLRRVRKAGFNIKTVALIGDAHSCRSMIETLRQDPSAGFAIRDIRVLDDARPIENMGIPIKPFDKNDLQFDCHEIWIALPVTETRTLQSILGRLDLTAVNIRYFPDLHGFRLINHQVSHIAGRYAFDVTLSPMQGMSYLGKWLEDKILGGALFLLALLPMTVVALLIWLTDGRPIFFCQDRVGWSGKPFKIIKFRSMKLLSPEQASAWADEENKPKTRLGDALRKWNLDELPQLWNVLRGEMSLVGPRPERVEFVETFKHEIPGYMQKHLMKAGMTGWAQIHGWRGDTDLQKRIEYDLWYIENWSLWLDLRILLQTLLLTLERKNKDKKS